MRWTKSAVALLFVVSFSPISAQNKSRVEFLADSAKSARDFLLCAKYYLQAAGHATSPETEGVYHYKAAICYAKAHAFHLANMNLRKSYELSAEAGKKPVTIQYIKDDYGLKTLWHTAGFKDIIADFYSKSEASEIFESVTIEEIDKDGLLKLIGESDAANEIIIKNKIIVPNKDAKNRDVITIGDINDPAKNLTFINCSSESKMYFRHVNLSELNFIECHWRGGIDARDEIRLKFPMKARNCIFDRSFAALFSVDNEYSTSWGGATHSNSFEIQGCSLKETFIWIDNMNPINININESVTTDSSDITIRPNMVVGLYLMNNNFQNNNIFFNEGEIRKIAMVSNRMHTIAFTDARITESINVIDNTFNGKLLFARTLIPDAPLSNIEWKDFTNRKTGYFINRDFYFAPGRRARIEVITGDKKEDVINTRNYKELMKVYAMFLKLFKESNDLEAYNNCYIDMKTLQSDRFRYQHDEHPSFETWFRWKLSRLLQVYVRYGTDPSRAILISCYIILAFGIFFSFFPSDWDTTSKAELIRNYKDFIGKNEKGYIVPFVILAAGLLMSLANAITLSLNAFITLGFGNIPTRGIARYFCVLEGFMGWFLLSIFTVALINQVL